MSKDYYLSIRELISEKILRNIILFFTLFIFTINQDWDNILLFVFPLITFSYSIIFELISENKWRIQINKDLVMYNPLGSEKTHSNRFFFSSLLLLIFLYWLGAESYYHPQLIDNYSLFFLILYIFIYTFTFFWIFLDIWNYCQIIVNLDKSNIKITEEDQNIRKFTHLMNMKFIKLISMISLTVFLITNITNILLSYFTLNTSIPGIEFNLPGTGIELSQGLLVHYLILPILCISPVLTIILFYLIYSKINKINPKEVEDFLDNCSDEIKELILENFRALNIKFEKEKNIK